MDWSQLMQQVNQAIFASPDTPHQPGHDPDNMVGNIEGMFEQYGQSGRQQMNEQSLGGLLSKVQQSIWNSPSTPHQRGNDPGNLLGTIGDLFKQYAQNNDMRVLPASDDPYGDPADMGQQSGMSVRPGSEDPYGDPADAYNQRSSGMSVRPASEDPYGDPADRGY